MAQSRPGWNDAVTPITRSWAQSCSRGTVRSTHCRAEAAHHCKICTCTCSWRVEARSGKRGAPQQQSYMLPARLESNHAVSRMILADRSRALGARAVLASLPVNHQSAHLPNTHAAAWGQHKCSAQRNSPRARAKRNRGRRRGARCYTLLAVEVGAHTRSAIDTPVQAHSPSSRSGAASGSFIKKTSHSACDLLAFSFDTRCKSPQDATERAGAAVD